MGTITGDVTNDGTLLLGITDQQVRATVDGDYTQTGLIVLQATDWANDHVLVTGTATLGGTLQFQFPPNYTGSPGSSWAALAYGEGVDDGVTILYPEPPPDSHWEAHFDDPAYPDTLSMWLYGPV
jgi:hypothetical protein